MLGRSLHVLRVLAAALGAGLLPAAIALSATTTFEVTVPESTPESELVYVTGDFQGWNPGDPAYTLTEQPGGTWEITIELPEGMPIEFKFTRGTWETVEKGPSGEEIANRTHTPNGTETLELAVASWADIPVSTISGHVEWFEHVPFLGGRRCWVYLPPGYFESTDTYPVLYMHDGQNLFDVATSFAGEWRVDEACEALIPAMQIEPIIVVGIENSPNRCTEYTPWPNTDPEVACPGGGGADVYLQQIRDVLMPEVNLRYRTDTGPDRTYMAGSSLGGLVSVYAGYEYDDVWGRIAGVSPYYPWADRMMFDYASALPRPAQLTHFYQDMGTMEFAFIDENENGIDDFIDDLRTMRDIALAQGFVEGEDFVSVEGQGHTHNEYYWALRMPDILRFLIDPPVVSTPDTGPQAFTPLVAAHPNPLRTGTRLGFTLAREARARLDLFDAAGRLVRRLAGGRFAAGPAVVTWNGRDASERPVAPGTYWVRLDVDGTTSATARLVRVP